MKFMYSILVSCLLFIGQAQATNFKLFDATSFDPQPVLVSAADNSVPIGTVIIWTKEIIPEGWLECNGQKVNDILYPELAALMPNTPNYKGRFLQGIDTNTKVGDRIEAALPQIPAHRHSYKSSNGIDGGGAIGDGGHDRPDSWNTWKTQMYVSLEDVAWDPIYGHSDTVQPPAVVVKYIIKAE